MCPEIGVSPMECKYEDDAVCTITMKKCVAYYIAEDTPYDFCPVFHEEILSVGESLAE